MATNLINLLNKPIEKIDKAFVVWHNTQTISDQRAECFESAFQELGLPDQTFDNIAEIPKIIKVYILYLWLTSRHNIQGERVTKESKDLIKKELYG